MIFVGIDVAKDKHDCFILNSEGTVLANVRRLEQLCFKTIESQKSKFEPNTQNRE